jgi:hypothetical protein
VIVVAQTPEVIEGYHLQVWPGENVRQLLADGFEDADSRQFLDALGKGFLLSLGLKKHYQRFRTAVGEEYAKTNPTLRFPEFPRRAR